jgi:hypothetical protein
MLYKILGDDTISALADLAAIFKLKLRQTPPPTPQVVPPLVFQHPCLAESSTKILNSPVPISRQTRSQTTIHTPDIPNVSLPQRVVTTRTLRPSPPRVPTLSGRPSPRNLSKTTSAEWTQPTWPSPLEKTIGLGSRHWKRNGIFGTHEGYPSTTTLDARI